ncbi:MAG: hypothetical protein DI529_03585 [Chryseobacterium sp.]|nr:MAG: hypothetical protein DI529_03585 [Chryseobacterium sp.]
MFYKYDIRILGNNIPKKEKLVHSFEARKFAEIEKENKIDILIFGSSLATRNYDARVFKENKYQYYNLGTSSQKPNLTNIIARKYFQIVKPKLVIIDVNPYLMLNPTRYENVSAIMNSRNSIYDYDMFMTAPSLMAFNALIIKYTGIEEENRLKKLNDSISEKKDRYISGGFITSNQIYDNKIKTPEIKINNFIPLEKQQESLENLIDFLKKNNTDYILVLSPLNKKYFAEKSKVKIDKFRNLSRLYFSKYGNYIDSNTLENYDCSDFMDFSHLNNKGSRKFVNSLLPIIKKNQK